MAIPGVGKQTIDDISVNGKTVFVRVDYNVPFDEHGHIVDDTRIAASLPTLRALLAGKPKRLVLASHLGRPKGKPDPAFSMAPVAPALERLLGVPVTFLPDAFDAPLPAAVEATPAGSVVLLENLRFHAGEEKGDESFAKLLAQLAEVYVNDAFGTCHRPHASMYALPKLLPVKVAGYLVAKELEALKGRLDHPVRPFYAIIGGGKVTDKIAVLERLLQKADAVLIGGAMAYPFLKVLGIGIGKSRCADEDLDPARSILAAADTKGVSIHLPVDHVIAETFAADAPTQTTLDRSIPEGFLAIDIGPRTRENYAEVLGEAKTIFWNGPMGVYEFASGAEGTKAIAQTLAGLAAMTIIGGGDSVAAVNDGGLAEAMGHVSTGGGASLELVEGKELPGVEVLDGE